MSTHTLSPAEAPLWHLAPEDEHAGEAGHEPGGATLLGFWIYLMSDALIFAALFATFGVLSTSYAGGPTPREVFELPLVAVNTALLLISSLTFGMAMLAMMEDRLPATRLWLLVTAGLGLGFLGIELYEFAHLVHEGAGPTRSAFLSAFFTLVGTHGLHVTFGLVWIAVMLAQLRLRGFDAGTRRGMMCLSMFWHFLDIIWIGVFTFVYLFGVLR